MPLSSRIQGLLARRRLPLVAVLLTAVLSLPSLSVGLQLDDYAHRALLVHPERVRAELGSPLDLFNLSRGDPARMHKIMDAGFAPWWTDVDLRLAFWRPLSALTHWLDHNAWPTHPAWMHLQSVLWLAAVVAVAAALYRRHLAQPAVAGLAALLYAVDDAHAATVSWLANRNALVAACFGFLSLLAHDRYRRAAWRPGAIAAPLCLGLALLSGESGVATGAYLLAHALFLDPAPVRRRLIALAPHALVAGAWWAAYKAQGFGASGSDAYLDPAHIPFAFLRAALERAPALFLGQWLAPPSDLYPLLSTTATAWLAAAGWTFMALVALALRPLLRQDPTARYFAAGTLLSLAPICGTFPSDRLLLFTGYGAMGLIAQLLGAFLSRAGWVVLPASGPGRLGRRALGFAFVLVHAVLAPLSFPAKAPGATVFAKFAETPFDAVLLDPSVERDHAIVVNPPLVLATGLLSTLRDAQGLPRPRFIRCLSPGIHGVELRRTDDRTLIVRPTGGYLQRPGALVVEGGREERPAFYPSYLSQHLDRVFRGDAHPMALGEKVELTLVTVEVTALTPDGRPAEATFRFAAPLEDARLHWIAWAPTERRFLPFSPPTVGETVRLEPFTLPLFD